MKKGLITVILTLILLLNTYTPIFATAPSPEPGVAIPIGVTAGEVITLVGTVLTYMGIQFTNELERQRWIQEEYYPGSTGYADVEKMLRDAKVTFANESNNMGNKPDPRKIAIPIPDNIIDSIVDKLEKFVTGDESNVDSQFVLNYISSNFPDAKNIVIFKFFNDPNNPSLVAFFTTHPSSYVEKNITSNSYIYNPLMNEMGQIIGSNYYYVSYDYQYGSYDWSSTLLSNRYKNGSTMDYNYFQLLYDSLISDGDYKITLPAGDFIKSWVSPYTGMQTVTIPLTRTGIETPLEVPLIPGSYVEPVPDEVVNPITKPVNDPLIDPETGLPFIGPDGLPIFPTTPLVPITPLTPIPLPETLTQPKDYTPNLTEIINGIKQLPEKIINPIKQLFIPNKVDNIDFSPLNVPVLRKFPFCIPWDLKNMIVIFDTPPIAPKFEFNISIFDEDYPIVWDFAIFNELAEITRFFVLMGVIVGLILITRNLIRG